MGGSLARTKFGGECRNLKFEAVGNSSENQPSKQPTAHSKRTKGLAGALLIGGVHPCEQLHTEQLHTMMSVGHITARAKRGAGGGT